MPVAAKYRWNNSSDSLTTLSFDDSGILRSRMVYVLSLSKFPSKTIYFVFDTFLNRPSLETLYRLLHTRTQTGALPRSRGTIFQNRLLWMSHFLRMNDSPLPSLLDGLHMTSQNTHLVDAEMQGRTVIIDDAMWPYMSVHAFPVRARTWAQDHWLLRSLAFVVSTLLWSIWPVNWWV